MLSVAVTPQRSPRELHPIGLTQEELPFKTHNRVVVKQPNSQECNSQTFARCQSTSQKAEELLRTTMQQSCLPTDGEASTDVEKPTMPVKMFVNRIPKWMTNEQLKTLFSTHGQILETTVLKDANQQSKGCAFVRFMHVEEAHRAIQNLHNKIVLTEEAGPVQVKYADGEIERLKLSHDMQPGGDSIKVFVGCLPKTCNEDVLHNLFSRYGRVDEVYIIRCKQSKQSKCSAFVTFPKLAMAEKAINELNRQYMLPGSIRPVEVRLAETKLTRSKNGGISRSNSEDVNSSTTLPNNLKVIENCHVETASEQPQSSAVADRNAKLQALVSDDKAAKPEGGQKEPNCSHTKRVFGSWWEFLSPGGQLYYYNICTRVSKWELPQDWNMFVAAPRTKLSNLPNSWGNAVACESMASAIEPLKRNEIRATVFDERVGKCTPEIPTCSSRWLRCLSDEGKLYYYDTLTRKTQWASPEVLHRETAPSPGKQGIFLTSRSSGTGFLRGISIC
eukprot:GHVT01067439.1.p1 GENE.GHVT01067439.1~~GHVT01067439.1.p1  ORF type:complete len:503 (-),score=34.06 GHVT01067439.1:6444-7952(-)